MFIKIPPWYILVAKFGLDGDGDIGDNDHFYFTRSVEPLLSPDRMIEISDTLDDDNDYTIKTHDLANAWPQNYLHADFVDFCLEYEKPSYGVAKTLGIPIYFKGIKR